MLYCQALLPLIVLGALHSVTGQSFSFGSVIGTRLENEPSVPRSAVNFSPRRLPASSTPNVAVPNNTARRTTSRSRGASQMAPAAEETSRGRTRQTPKATLNINKPSFQQSSSSFSFSGLSEIAPTPTKAAQRESTKENEIVIGRSPCVRGLQGQTCRLHLQQTAMACTSGKCQQCQQCGSIAATEWVSCCRDHFLCCHPLAKSCLNCDQPILKPFCSTAFGKCSL